MNRKQGTTAEQMLNAVGGSIYVWPVSRSIDYAIKLATHIGREDLKIYSLSDLNYPEKFRGIDIYGVVVDHACYGFMGHKHHDTLTKVIKPRIREVNYDQNNNTNTRHTVIRLRVYASERL